MRIVIISDVYFPRVNGVSSSIRTFRRELEALGHEVYLIAPDYGESCDPEEESGIFRVASRTVYLDPEDRMMHFSGVMQLEGELRSLQPDLIHIQTPFVAYYAGVHLAGQLGLPTVLTYHTYFEEYLFHYVRFLPRWVLRWLVRHLTRKQCSQVDSVVVPTQAFSQVLTDYGVRTELHINPTGIDLQRLGRGNGERFRQEHGIDQARPVLLFVGRLVHEKNIGFLLRVVARLKRHRPDIMLLLAGEGPAESHLKTQAQQLGVTEQLCFVGNLPTQQLQDCYSAGDLFVFASRTETQGLVLLEAMAQGLPVVSIARMGTVDILAPARGARVVEEDEVAFAGVIEELLNRPEEMNRLAQDGRDYVNGWSAPVMAMRLEDLYMETVESAFFFGREIGSSR